MLEDPLASGSLGAGLLLEPPVRAEFRPGGMRLAVEVVGPKPSTLDVLLSLLRSKGLVLHGRLRVTVPRPLGAGYGVSGAVTLASSLAIAAAAGASLETAARLAHAAEVVAGTGLGDVLAQYEGRMLEVRIVPGAPGVGRLLSLPVKASHVVTAVLRTEETRHVHARAAELIAMEGIKSFVKVLDAPGLETFLEEARRFSLAVGFVSHNVASALDRLVARGAAVGWYVKKGVLVVVPERGAHDDVAGELRVLGLRPRWISVERVASAPARVRPCGSPGATRATGAS